MLLNKAVIEAGTNEFRILFNKGLAAAGTPQWTQIAMRQPSSGAMNTYGWLKDIPGMRQWLGDRVHHNLSAQGFTVPNLDFELTVDVNANDFADNNLSTYTNPMQSLGFSAAQDPDRRVFALLAEGFTTLCHDGKVFYATDHPHPKTGHAAWGNKATKKISAANFKTGFDAIASQTNAAGDPAGVRATHLVHGPLIEDDVFGIVKAEKLAGLADNPNFNKVKTIMSSWIPDYAWFLMDLSRPFLLPLLLQVRQEPVFAARDQVTDENVFEKKVLTYGVNDRKAAAFTLPQLAYGSTGADAA
ncbi:MAG: Mu-like prophage major head subunit gpT family protein [Verrucomicrobia bacterium]|nr:Mu-like prophage major head subunit gpT family protein [Verrucomicrobiota bacterium]